MNLFKSIASTEAPKGEDSLSILTLLEPHSTFSALPELGLIVEFVLLIVNVDEEVIRITVYIA